MADLDQLGGYLNVASGKVWLLFSSPGSFLSPIPILAAIIIGALVICARRIRRGEVVSLRAIAKEIMPPESFRHPSTRHDMALILINDGLLFIVPLAGAFAAAVLLEGIGALRSDGEPYQSVFHFVAFAIYFALVWDFFSSFSHYLKHKIPFLWEFHKVHHCAEVMTPLTAMRRHPVEVMIGAVITGTGIGIAVALWGGVFGAPGATWAVGGASIGVYLWRLLGYNLRHSHVWISYGSFWNNIFVSPAHHQLHHSRDPRHHDCNFGHIFSVWDRLFGTLYHPVEGEAFEYGISPEENAKMRTLRALYFRPFQQVARRFAPQRIEPAPMAE